MVRSWYRASGYGTSAACLGAASLERRPGAPQGEPPLAGQAAAGDGREPRGRELAGGLGRRVLEFPEFFFDFLEFYWDLYEAVTKIFRDWGS